MLWNVRENIDRPVRERLQPHASKDSTCKYVRVVADLAKAVSCAERG